MSKAELLAKLKLVRAQTDTTVDLLSNAAALPFSLDDEYEADYLVGCLQSNSEKLYSLAKKCQSASKSDQQVDVVTEQCGNFGKLLTASVSSAVEDSRASPVADHSDVKDADSDETASMTASEMSAPICGDNVSDDCQFAKQKSFFISLYHVWVQYMMMFFTNAILPSVDA